MKKTLIALAAAGFLLCPAVTQARDLQGLGDRNEGGMHGDRTARNRDRDFDRRSGMHREFDRRHAMEGEHRRFGREFNRGGHMGERTARNRGRDLGTQR
jgi:Ni/Co efflux regulator RcnB